MLNKHTVFLNQRQCHHVTSYVGGGDLQQMRILLKTLCTPYKNLASGAFLEPRDPPGMFLLSVISETENCFYDDISKAI